jgi:protein-disulfide isomerase
MKSAYIDPGKVKFVFRELPVHGAIDVAIFSVARCAGPEDYFAVLDEAVARQDEIVRSTQSVDGPQKELVALGQKFRLSAEQVQACIRDPKNIDRIYEVDAVARARGINSTPTFFINDRELNDYRFSEMSAQIDALLAAGATPAPAETPAASEAPAQPAPQ